MVQNGLKIGFTKLVEHAIVPAYAHATDCCCDLYASEEVTIKRFERKLVGTGIAIELPEGFEAQVRPRSGNAWKYGLTVLNTPGTIDEEYRGELKVILINLGDEDYTIKVGDRIAQMKFSPVYIGYFLEKKQLTSSDRGANGLGSTGN